MEKKEMVKRTMKSFLHKLEQEGHSKYASELKYLLAMSRERKEAVNALSSMAPTLLAHIIKYLALSKSQHRKGWLDEIHARLAEFSLHNVSFKNRPWLSIEHIEKELNEFIANPRFLRYLMGHLKTYSDNDRKSAQRFLEAHRTIKGFNVKLFFDAENNLEIKI